MPNFVPMRFISCVAPPGKQCTLAKQRFFVYIHSVSLAEIRDQIAGLTVEERLDLAALIAHLNRADDPAYQSELDRRAANMDAGKKSTLDELELRHQRLAADGR
jgi:hypothetical protein